MKKGLFLWDMTELIDLCISALSENKGEWINTEEEGQYKCNNCGKICGFKKDKTYGYYVAEDLCPNCGADMRGKAK